MDPDARLPGLTLNGRFADLVQIGAGGMARVFRARDLTTGDLVAVKILRPESATRRGLIRFAREIRIIRDLRHENVLTLLDTGVVSEGEFSGCPFFAMPLITGESLRARLDRERQLQIPDAVRIVTAIARGLAAAHALGVVHRDVKPENVLLDGDRVLVADFGIARVSELGEGVTSSTGIAVGTPTYMSPEQVAGDRALDRRSDIYSLGIVAYELLAGNPPFSGSSPQALSARHLFEPPPPLRVVRPDVDERLWGVINRALAKVPAARQESCEAFIDTLDASLVPQVSRAEAPFWRRRIALPYGILATLIVVAGAAWIASRRPGPLIDSSRVMVFPWTGSLEPGTLEERLRGALRTWNGLGVVDQLETPHLVASGLSLSALADRARDVAAGLAITGSIAERDGDVVLSTRLIDVRSAPKVVRASALHWPTGRDPSDSAFRSLAEALLFPETARGAGSESYPATLAFAKGLDAASSWELVRADAAFESATRADQHFSKALLWLALVRTWRERPTPEWSHLLVRARDVGVMLDGREGALLAALTRQAKGDFVGSCKAWGDLTKVHGADFASWYGLAYCLRSDAIVVGDRTVAGGWRFRADKTAALAAYRRSLELLPASHRALSSNSFEVVRRSLLTSMTDFLEGRTETGDVEFAALPALEGGNLVMRPIPKTILQRGDPRTLPPSHRQAVLGQRRLFDSLTATWVSAFPQSSDALLARAIGLEMMGDERMFSTVAEARRMAANPEAALQTGFAHVRMLVKLGIDSPKLLVAGRNLADSLLQRFVPDLTADHMQLATLAALTGKVDLAAQLLRRTGADPGRARKAIEVEADVLLLFAASDASADSVEALSRRLENLLAEQEPSLRRTMEMAWVARAATLWFPHPIAGRSLGLLGGGDYLLDAQLLLRHGDTAKALRDLKDVVARRTAPSAEQSLDAVCSESATAAAAGDAATAYKWVSAMLSSFSSSPPDALSDHTRAALLGPCLLLAARLAEQTGDASGANRWRVAARTLTGARDK